MSNFYKELRKKLRLTVPKSERIDIKAGKMNFGHRIQLGKILASDSGEFEKIESIFICLHGFKPRSTSYKKYVTYFKDITEGIRFWMGKEVELLNYEPTPEEKRAGVKDLSKKVGEFGTVKALAKAYSKDPDEVLKWEYGKVFGILYTDLEEYKFQVRYNKVIESKR